MQKCLGWLSNKAIQKSRLLRPNIRLRAFLILLLLTRTQAKLSQREVERMFRISKLGTFGGQKGNTNSLPLTMKSLLVHPPQKKLNKHK